MLLGALLTSIRTIQAHLYTLRAGCSHRGYEGAAPPIFSLWAHLPNLNRVYQRCLPTKLKGSPICRQIGLERSLFVGKFGLCTPPTIFFSFAPIERPGQMRKWGLPGDISCKLTSQNVGAPERKILLFLSKFLLFGWQTLSKINERIFTMNF